MPFPWQTIRNTGGEVSGMEGVMRQSEASGSTMKTILFEEAESIFSGSPFMPSVTGTRSSSRPVAPTGGGSVGHAIGPPSDSKTPTKEMLRKPQAPEKSLTLFAMRLAVLEKVASNVGTLGFIWATVVLLGGFAVTLREIDFWFVTVILVIEGCRIFSRSHELEWQHQDAGILPGNSFSRAIRRSSDALFRSKREIQSAVSNVVSAEHNDDSWKQQTPHHQDQPSHVSPYSPMDTRSHVSPYSPMDTRTDSFHANVTVISINTTPLRRTWSSSRVSLVPFSDWIFRASHISRFLYWMQLVGAATTIALSVYRLRKHNFIGPNETDTVANHTSALFIFYSLATFEALVFLLERSYWQTQISLRKILVRVNERCGLATEDLSTTRRFFYDVYSKCLTESIFEGLKMDMVDYALTWLQSDLPGEQLGGLRVLLSFSSNSPFSEDTLRTTGNRQGAVERLLDMITWKNTEEQEIRKAAASMLGMLVKYNRNCVRVAAISGSIEGIFSLLMHDDEGAYYIKRGGSEPMGRKNIEMIVIGLRILKNLAKDPLNCGKIGVTRGLLTRLISFIDTSHETLRSTAGPRMDHHVPMVKKSLELLNLLAAATGASGKMLREEIAKVVFTMPNLRRILEHAQSDGMTALAVELLSSLSMDDEVREIIGRTGGIIRNLLAIFVRQRTTGDKQQAKLARQAGEALSLLALKNEENCWRMIRLKVKDNGTVVAAEEADPPTEEKDAIAKIVDLLENWDVGDLAMILLRSFCAYTGNGAHKVRIATSTAHRALSLAMHRTGYAQQAALGLLATSVSELTSSDIDKILAQAGMSAYIVTQHIVELIQHHQSPSTSLPHIRRYCVELVMALVECHPHGFLDEFHAFNFQYVLHHLADSASELENFATFSGANGVTPHSVPMWLLVERAMQKLKFHHLVSP